MTTLVTAFVTGANKITHRKPADYIELGKKLFRCRIPKIVFIEKSLYDQGKLEDEKFVDTQFVFIKGFTDLYLYDYLKKLDKFMVRSTAPDKDTPGFMITMCNKTEWMRDAIKIDPFQSKNFVWVDFGIFYIVKDEKKFTEFFEGMSTKTYDRQVRIAGCWDLKNQVSEDLFLHEPNWYFLGGVFGGDREAILKFANLTQLECFETIEKYHTLPWEINIWYRVYLKNPKLFSVYKADHNLSIAENY